MKGKTHFAAGLAIGLGFLYVLHIRGMTAFISLYEGGGIIAAAAAGALVPDIDIPTSSLGSKIKPISKGVNKAFGHRGLFHAPLLYIALYICMTFILPQTAKIYLMSFMLGILSHMILDLLNKAGIPILYPILKGNVHLASFSASGMADLVCRVVMYVAVITLVCILGGHAVIQKFMLREHWKLISDLLGK